MPIQFPQPSRGNPFDRWLWQRGAKPPQQQPAPNLAAPGLPFTRSTMSPGGPRARVAVNVRSLGRMYQHGEQSGARPNPAAFLVAARPVRDGSVIGLETRVGGIKRMQLSGVSRDSTGAALGGCTVMVFRTTSREFVGETVSDGSGNWTFDVMSGAGAFFLVEYKAGSPDVAGTSVNTLTPDPV